MLDYGYRSRCCKAPIRLGSKKSSYNKTSIKVWICTKCRRANIDIIPVQDINNQEDRKPFSSFDNSRD